MTTRLHELSLATLSEQTKPRTEQLFHQYLAGIPASELKAAMAYTLLNGGKHIRPLLVYATGAIFDAPLENLDIPASVVELIHAYSLIHDDLPAMDNADLRRGKPSCHRAFSEGLAILAGDSLHTLAIQIMAGHPAPLLKPERRNRMITTLTEACGPYGMAAGQALDITIMHDRDISIDLLTNIYQLKTGMLFSACIELGRLASKDDDAFNQQALMRFSKALGLAFQIQDDILDMEAETALLGKTKDTDTINRKITYPKITGLSAAKDTVQTLYQEALEAINYLGDRANALRDLTRQLLERKK
ncbi:MAG: hypothetical protein A3F43_05360 [Gammaproteobacteria bacterium RIFCSPHIGHO2_12_FULL_42_10]|nr:MAG: hypothetical protein A3F43_05360 [Gammaproteobacteria bacterium RIFCSPHIGHO2_12_FULL_42_10]